MRTLSIVYRASSIAAIVALAGTVGTLAVESRAGCGRQPTIGDLASSLLKVGGVSGGAGSQLASRVSDAVRGKTGAALTEGEAAALLRLVGADVTTSAPARLIAPGRIRTLLLIAAGALRTEAASGRFVTSEVSLTSRDDCVSLRTHGECVDCCKAAGGAANTCAKECFAINKPSPSEPLP